MSRTHEMPSTPETKRGHIIIRGARTHNLKNVDLTLPSRSLIVMTGVSGSGKSSLAFDTIYAEGQRRYVESLSAYARQFLERMEKPDVDGIDHNGDSRLSALALRTRRSHVLSQLRPRGHSRDRRSRCAPAK